MPDNLLDIPFDKLSPLALLVLALVGAWRRWWVVGTFYAEMKKERDDAIAKRDADNDVLERLVRLSEAREQAERERR